MPSKNNTKPNIPKSFNNMYPRTLNASVDHEREKKGTGYAGATGMGFSSNVMSGFGASQNILRNPARRFYDPEVTTTAIYLPKNSKQRNRWNRWFYDHDELVGAVFDLHAELPHSRAEVEVDDPVIKQTTEDCFTDTKFFSHLPLIDLEYMKIGEVFIHTTWSDDKGYWDNIIIHNPDYIDVKFSPLVDQGCVIELKPDEELRSLVHSTKPEDQRLKKRLPKDVVRRVLTGRNILLDDMNVTHIARRSNPYDERGTSILLRLYRLLMYEDKLREAQITIADNFIYPLKIFKLGDPQKGWIPNESHSRALSQMLQQANFDPNFSLIYHYGIDVQYVTVADKVMKLEKEWSEINEKKMIALGVSKQFLNAETTYSSANVGLQTQLSRYQAKRDLFEGNWIKPKFLRGLAKKNEWYRRDSREILGKYRVNRSAEENEQRLIIPDLVWRKKLMMRDDQQFLQFLHNVYSQGKGPVSPITLLMAMGLDAEDELKKKQRVKELEEIVGQRLITPTTAPGGIPGAPSIPGGMPGTLPPPPAGIVAKLKSRFKIGSSYNDEPVKFSENIEVEKSTEPLIIEDENEKKEFVGEQNNNIQQIPVETVKKLEVEDCDDLLTSLKPISKNKWLHGLRSQNIPPEVVSILNLLNNKLEVIPNKYESVDIGIKDELHNIIDILFNVYKKGKLQSYSNLDVTPISILIQNDSIDNTDFTDYSDMVLLSEFENWIDTIRSASFSDTIRLAKIRDLGNTCYAYGQLKGYQEYGIFSVKLHNTYVNDGYRYKVSELLDKGLNLSSVISPVGEIIVLSACIEGFDDEFLENSVDSSINRYSDFTVSDFTVTSCPIEFVPHISRFLSRAGTLIKPITKLSFVKDVIDTKAWEEVTKKKLAVELRISESNNEKRDSLLQGSFLQYKEQKRGSIQTFIDGTTMYISNSIGMDDLPFTVNLLNNLNVDNDTIKKAIKKNFNFGNNDLSDEDISTYRVFDYIEPIYDANKELLGWEATKRAEEATDKRLVRGKMWNARGKCAQETYQDPMKLYENSIRLWVDYPHKLSDDLAQAYEKLFNVRGD
jgi:hypothetical protein